ncbi:MAG: VOC family protein [Bacteroidota bacterium]
MKVGGRAIDHLVYVVPDFEAGISQIRQLFGMDPKIGGKHPTQGTQNALIHLGDTCYFEILAVDEKNIDILPPRWMGIDLIQVPTLSRWCLKSDKLEEDAAGLKRYYTPLSEVMDGKRRLPTGDILEWKLSLPLAEPEVEVIPFFIDWKNSQAHPTDHLAEGCHLENIRFSHPKPEKIEKLFHELGISINIEKSDFPRISAHIQTPNGLISL